MRKEIEQWLPRVGPDDAVLLIQDAVLALKGAPGEVGKRLDRMEGRLYALEADLLARGIPAAKARVTDDRGAISLITRAKRVLAL